MIVDKNKKPVVSEPTVDETVQAQPRTELETAIETNAMVEAYKAVKRILLTIKEDPNDPNSPPFFKTIKWDNGQLARIKNNKHNQEYSIAFPAVFIHYIDVYYNVGAAKISDGKGVMRLHYVLNRLNNSDDDVETEGLEIYKRIIAAIESHKSEFPSLVQRFQLQYWDQPLTFDDGLQPFWIDYQIWFSDYTAFMYKDYVDVYTIAPPFTQHSDQNEIANPDNLPNCTDPKFEDVVRLVDKR